MTMTCPACGGHDFAPARIEGELPADRCTTCEGVWVELERYKSWRSGMPALAVLEGSVELDEFNSPVRQCPVSGRLMSRMRVRHDTPLLLDYSAAAQAVWFDQGEWERLIGLGMHDQLDAIVSEKWQTELRQAASQARMEKALRMRFGDAAYERLAEMHAWLAGQPNRSEMIAFLNSRTD